MIDAKQGHIDFFDERTMGALSECTIKVTLLLFLFEICWYCSPKGTSLGGNNFDLFITAALRFIIDCICDRISKRTISTTSVVRCRRKDAEQFGLMHIWERIPDLLHERKQSLHSKVVDDDGT